MELSALARHPAVARARQLLRESDEETLADLVALTEIPAPPFGEERRGARVAGRFAELGLADTVRDAEGNVLARLPGAVPPLPPLLLSAHLDTIFPDGTEVRVRREVGRLVAPGIADNGRGLAGMLAVARALARAGVRTRHPVVFAATVGEEGIGDLRGVKHLFRPASPWRQAIGFVSLDGTGSRRIVHRALGSRRLRVTVRGPGGHSWADWGRGNPIHALGVAVADLARHAPPCYPRTTLTVGRIGGGTSVNAIPAEAWLELDLRSEDARALVELEGEVRRLLAEALAETNQLRKRGSEALGLAITVIGDRPSGEVPPDAPLVAAALAATRFIGETPELVSSSTDANVPIALGIPAIAIGAGGESGGTHTTGEWYRNDGGPEGLERVLLTLVAAAGLA